MLKPSISVVIPCYNHAKYLPETIASVVEQHLPIAEIIIVDDGSTDSTPDVVSTINDARVIYLRQENGGPSKARNHGLAIATGEFIGFLDADDLWRPGFADKMVSAIGYTPSKAAICAGYDYIDSDSCLVGRQHLPPNMATLALLLNCNISTSSACLYRTKTLRELGGFDEEIVGVEDWELLIRFAVQDQLETIQEVLIDYRVLPTSISKNVYLMRDNALFMYEKTYTQFMLPSDISAMREKLEAMCYLNAAAGDIRADDLEQARAQFVTAARKCPSILSDLHTYFAIICAKQPIPFLGTGQYLDLQEGKQLIQYCCQAVIQEYPDQETTTIVYMNIALGRLEYMRGNMACARRYWNIAGRADLVAAFALGWPLNVAKSYLRQSVIQKPKLVTHNGGD